MTDLIYNQRQIPREQWRYGLRSSAAVGCGWIATHNALHLLGYREEIPELIRYYECQAPLINGNLGTGFWGPMQCFLHWGFPVDLVTRSRSFDEAAMQVPVCILFYRWRRGLKVGAHFVALRYTPRGFVGYNTFSNSKGPDYYGPSLQAFIRERGWFGPLLFCIHPRKSVSPSLR